MRTLASDQAGNVAIMFGLALPVGVALVAASVNFANSNWQRSEAQTALDAAALGAVMLFSDASKTPADIESLARSFLASKAPKVPDINTKSTVSVEAAARTVEIGYDSKVESPISFVIWDGDVPVAATSRAVMQFNRLPVCIQITSPNQNHTLLGQNNAKIDLKHCLVQVDTQNWDAVEMRGTSYLHVKDGENCFVGDIHYGDVQPGKAPTCTFFGDPFKTLIVPTGSGGCKAPQSSGAFTPGVYCGGLTVTGDSTFAPGQYHILDGPLKIEGTGTDVTATNAVFFLKGHDAGFDFKSTGNLQFTAPVTGSFSGFTFFLDPAALGGKKGVAPESKISASQVTSNGYIYVAGQKLTLKNSAKLTVNPGGITADYLLPDNATVDVTGQIDNSTQAGLAMQKNSTTLATARLVK